MKDFDYFVEVDKVFKRENIEINDIVVVKTDQQSGYNNPLAEQKFNAFLVEEVLENGMLSCSQFEPPTYGNSDPDISNCIIKASEIGVSAILVKPQDVWSVMFEYFMRGDI